MGWGGVGGGWVVGEGVGRLGRRAAEAGVGSPDAGIYAASASPWRRIGSCGLDWSSATTASGSTLGRGTARREWGHYAEVHRLYGTRGPLQPELPGLPVVGVAVPLAWVSSEKEVCAAPCPKRFSALAVGRHPAGWRSVQTRPRLLCKRLGRPLELGGAQRGNLRACARPELGGAQRGDLS